MNGFSDQEIKEKAIHLRLGLYLGGIKKKKQRKLMAVTK